MKMSVWIPGAMILLGTWWAFAQDEGAAPANATKYRVTETKRGIGTVGAILDVGGEAMPNAKLVAVTSTGAKIESEVVSHIGDKLSLRVAGLDAGPVTVDLWLDDGTTRSLIGQVTSQDPLDLLTNNPTESEALAAAIVEQPSGKEALVAVRAAILQRVRVHNETAKAIATKAAQEQVTRDKMSGVADLAATAEPLPK